VVVFNVCVFVALDFCEPVLNLHGLELDGIATDVQGPVWFSHEHPSLVPQKCACLMEKYAAWLNLHALEYFGFSLF
jgi:hypothetical protein